VAGWQGEEKKRRIHRETPPERSRLRVARYGGRRQDVLREGGLRRFRRFSSRFRKPEREREPERNPLTVSCWRLTERNLDTMTPSHLDTSGRLAESKKVAATAPVAEHRQP